MSIREDREKKKKINAAGRKRQWTLVEVAKASGYSHAKVSSDSKKKLFDQSDLGSVSVYVMIGVMLKHRNFQALTGRLGDSKAREPIGVEVPRHVPDPTDVGGVYKGTEVAKVEPKKGRFADYEYKSSSPLIAEVRAKGNEADLRLSLLEEIYAIKSMIQKVIHTVDGTSSMIGKYTKEGVPIVMADGEALELLNKLTSNMSRMVVNNADLMSQDMISKDKLRVLAVQTVGLLERSIERDEECNVAIKEFIDFCGEIE